MIGNRFVLLAAFCFPLIVPAQSSKAAWEIDLSQFGYQGRPPAALGRLSPSLKPFATWAYQQGVSFIGQNIVVAYFVVHVDPSGAADKREPSLSDPFRLIAVFLNATNGSVIKRLDWPLPANPRMVSPSFFIPVAKDRFMVGLGNTLSLYSSDFKLLAHFDAQSDLSPIASPSGESILLSTSSRADGSWTTHYDLLDTANLSILKSWNEPASVPPHMIQALWNEELAWTSRSSIYFEPPGSAPRKLLANQGDHLCGAWSFAGKGELAGPVCGAANKLLTVSTEGSVVWALDLGFEQLDGPVVASPNGQRLAAPTFRWGSGRNNAPDELKARVFGLKSEVPLLTLSVPRNFGDVENYFFSSYGDTRFGWGGLALSQDGELLAVKSGPSVEVYRVPAIGSSSQCPPNCSNQASVSSSPPTAPPASAIPVPPSPLIQRMLSWFPADTETVTAVKGPFLLPKMEKDSSGAPTMAKSGHEVRDKFMQFPLLLLLDLSKSLVSQPIVAAIEGSRSFQPPTGLGVMKSEGGLIAVFASDITEQANSYLKDSAPSIVRTEQVEGHSVAIFEGKSEENLWTTYVAFPKPNIAVAANNEGYLREILARIDGRHGERALPDNLPEWKHVDTNAQFWAVRHYSKSGAQKDPTSPFNPGQGKDPHAIGLTFSFDPEKSKAAAITYLSEDEDGLQRFEKDYFAERSPAVTQMHVRYREIQPGIIEGSYDLEEVESADYFVFIFEALLGHGIYV